MIKEAPTGWLYKDTNMGAHEFSIYRFDHYFRPKYGSGDDHEYVKGIPLYTEEQVEAEVARRLMEAADKAPKKLPCTCFPHCDCDVDC